MRGLLEFLNAREIQSRPFWMPMNQLQMFADCTYVQTHNHSAQIYESCISIPSSAGISPEELQTVVAAIREFYQA
jgi:dTDP-4-amino-4,6-dideoxygalactose transaminase